MEALQAGAQAASTAKADEDSARRAVDKARLDEIAQLKELLEASRVSKREALEQYDTANLALEEALHRVESLENSLQALETDKAEVRIYTNYVLGY